MIISLNEEQASWVKAKILDTMENALKIDRPKHHDLIRSDLVSWSIQWGMDDVVPKIKDIYNQHIEKKNQ